MVFFIGLIAIVVMIYLTIRIMRWMMNPFKKAARVPPPKIQYFMTDIYALVLPAALGMLILGSDAESMFTHGEAGWAALFVLIYIFIVCFQWYRGIRMLSHAEVRQLWPRFVTLSFTYPFAMFSSFLASYVSILITIFGIFALYRGERFLFDPLVVLLFVAPSLFGVAFVIVRALSMWAVASAEPLVVPPPTIPEPPAPPAPAPLAAPEQETI